MLSENHGRLVDFEDSAGFASSIVALLDDEAETDLLRRRVYDRTRCMIWPCLAKASVARFEAVAERAARKPALLHPPQIPTQLGTSAIARLTDHVGMLQHSRFGVPDRQHGYCVDDNARALMLSCRKPEWADLTGNYSAFVDHAWNGDSGSFRNFMGYDRQWLEARGSEDSSGRTLWALGVVTRDAIDPEIRNWAAALFGKARDSIADMTSPRTMAFATLGLLAASDPDTLLLERMGDDLATLRATHKQPNWNWFEPVLAYDNARLCEAMISAGIALDRSDLTRAGLSTLDWLMALQTTSDGHFRAVGSDSFGRPYVPPLPFDQQPVDVWAAVDACAAAFAATGEARWKAHALNAWRWFMGQNELSLALADIETGECFDSLIPTGVNRNRGAESVLAFHLATETAQRLS